MVSPAQSGIYCIVNIANSKKYIGATKHFDRRKWQHFGDLKKNKHHNSHLQNAFNKYGKSNFVFFILEQCDIESLDKREKFYIKLFNSNHKDYGYNFQSGGFSYNNISDEVSTRLKKSNGRNKSGILRVTGRPCEQCVDGYRWVFTYYVKKTGKYKQITSTDPQKLKKKVIDAGFEWEVIDEKLAEKNNLL